MDIPLEIKRIKKDMNIDIHGLPRFWRNIHPEYSGYINNGLRCPMNTVSEFRLQRTSYQRTIPNQEFFVKHELVENRRKCKRVEELIQKYSLKLYEYNANDEADDSDYLLLRADFDNLVNDIRRTYISNNYLGLMSWLIDRSLRVTNRINSKNEQIKTALDKNRSLLMKTLYTVSPNQFLQCFKHKSVQ